MKTLPPDVTRTNAQDAKNPFAATARSADPPTVAPKRRRLVTLWCLGALLLAAAPNRNQAAAVFVSSPADGAVFVAPASIFLSAFATNPAPTLATLELFAGSDSLGEASLLGGSTFLSLGLVWSNATPGTYAFTAKATDFLGVATTSAVVNITLASSPPPTNPPAIYVSVLAPTNGAAFTAPVAIPIYAFATNASGSIASIQLFANSTSLGVTNFASGSGYGTFTMVWTNMTPGVYSLTARATDLFGASATSMPVNITISGSPPPTNPPAINVAVVTPPNGASFTAPTVISIVASATNASGSIASIQLFANSTSLGLTNLPVGSTYSRFFVMWTNNTVGSYALTAKATDAFGASATSAPVNITVTGSQPPTNPPAINVAILAPTNGAAFSAPASIPIFAFATNASGSIASIQLFANSSSLGITNLVPGSTYGSFIFLWTNMTAGVYSLTAKASDAFGASATSAPVNITISGSPPPTNPPPGVTMRSPTNGSTFTTSTIIPISAYATNAGGSIASIEVFANSTSLGVSNLLSGAKYGTFILWTNMPAGIYSLFAQATDSLGASVTSAPVNITVTASGSSNNLLSGRMLANGTFRLLLPQQTCVIEASTDPGFAHPVLITNTCWTSNGTSFIDFPSSDRPSMFYRVAPTVPQ